MRFCTSCGARLTEGARFCTSCGAPVVSPMRPQPSTPPAAPTSSQDERSPAVNGAQHVGDISDDATRAVPVNGAWSAPSPSPSRAPQPSTGSAAQPTMPWLSGAPAPSNRLAMSRRPQTHVDWRAHLPGILRLVAALALALTTLPNWWSADFAAARDATGDTFDGDDDVDTIGDSLSQAFYDHVAGHTSTVHHVLPLIGVVGVVLCVIAQIVRLPGIAGGQLAPPTRFAIRSVLCLPAIVAVVLVPILFVAKPEANTPGFAPVLLALAAGFAIAGLDDERDGVVSGVMRWATVVLAIVGTLLQVATFIIFIAASSSDDTKTPAWLWLILGLHYLLIAGVGALVAFVVATGKAVRSNLVIALAVASALGLLLRGWMQNNVYLALNTLLFQGPGLAFIVLAVALGTSRAAWRRPPADAVEPASHRWTSWVTTAFVIAAFSSSVEFVLMVAARVIVGKAPVEYTDVADRLDENSGQISQAIGFSPKLPTEGGTTWMAILLALLAVAYGLLAVFARRHPQGRLFALLLVPALVLTTLITDATSSVFGLVSLTFDVFALWLPLLATAALVLPPPVRAAAGPLLSRPAGPADATGAQAAFAQAPHQQS